MPAALVVHWVAPAVRRLGRRPPWQSHSNEADSGVALCSVGPFESVADTGTRSQREDREDQVDDDQEGQEAVYVKLTSKSDTPLRIVIAPGVFFKPSDARVQSMVDRKRAEVALDGRGSVKSLGVEAACANMHLATPTGETTFTVGPTGSADLQRLVELQEFSKEPFALQQHAIWVLTDNPARDEFTSFSGSGVGTSSGDIVKIRSLFARSGIDSGKFRALR